MERVYRARNQLGLVGKHIHIQTGAWTEPISGIGYNADSFYEYALKASILFGDERYKAMFDVLYSAVEHRLRNGDWYTEFDMRLGRPKVHRTSTSPPPLISPYSTEKSLWRRTSPSTPCKLSGPGSRQSRQWTISMRWRKLPTLPTPS